jgi:ribosomal protein S18 acetylase RimI-like enzyme
MVQSLRHVPIAFADPLFTGPQVTALLRNPHFHLLQATAGHLLLHTPPAMPADLLTLFVPPAQRRQGHARALLQAAIPLARAAGCPSLTLEVRASNAPAQALYQQLGFTIVGRRQGYYTAPPEDALVLSLHLG